MYIAYLRLWAGTNRIVRRHRRRLPLPVDMRVWRDVEARAFLRGAVVLENWS
jgi:hypothetical protein